MTSREELTRALLRTHDAATVVTLLNNTLSGAKVSYDHVLRLRQRMVNEGAIAPVKRHGPQALSPEEPGIPALDHSAHVAAAKHGCDKLLEATQALYRKTASRLGCSDEAATLMLNYSPAQLAKRVAA